MYKNRFFYIILLLFVVPIYSQEIIKNYDLDKDVYFDLSGTWKFELSSSANGDPSSLLNNFLPVMKPDLTAGLWLFNTFFFEAKIQEISLDNEFLLGFQGDFYGLKEVRIGNSDLSISKYAGYVPSTPKAKTPGGRIKFQTETATNELLFRYTKRNKIKDSYTGFTKKDEVKINYGDYTRGHFFILPDSINEYQIYADDKILAKRDYIFYPETRILYIPNTYSNIFLITNDLTTEELFSFSDPQNSPILPNEIITSSNLWDYLKYDNTSSNMFLLYDPNKFTPFEFLGSYSAQISENTEYLVDLDSRPTLNYLLIDNYVLIKDKAIDTNDLLTRLPLNDYFDYLDKETTYYLTLRSTTEISQFYLDENANQNSLEIYINGIKTNDYLVNWETKEVKFNNQVSVFDNIDIIYEIDNIFGIGNLLTVYGGSFNLLKNLNLELSGVYDWNILDDNYSFEDSPSSARLNLSGRLSYIDSSKLFAIEGGITSLDPDTSLGHTIIDLQTKNSLFDNNSTADFQISWATGNPLISVLKQGDLSIMGHSSNIDINKYSFLYFEFINSGALNETSLIEIIIPGNNYEYKFIISSDIQEGLNKIQIPINNNEKINSISNKIYINFKNINNGEIAINSILLTDSIIEMTQYIGAEFKLSPNIDISFPAFDLLVNPSVYLSGNLAEDYSLKGGVRGGILGTGIDLNFYKTNIDQGFTYTLRFPNRPFPIYFEEVINYDRNISRKERLFLNFDAVGSNLELSNILTNNAIVKKSLLKIDLREPFLLNLSTELKQEKEHNVTFESPYIESYKYLFPNNENDYLSMWNISSSLSGSIGVYTPEISFSNNFIQNDVSINNISIHNNLLFNHLSAFFNIESSFKQKPSLASNLLDSANNSIELLMNGPYNTLTLEDLFLGSNNQLYYTQGVEGDKKLETSIKLGISFFNNKYLADITYYHTKKYERRSDLDFTEILHVSSLNVEYSDLLKNTFTVEYIEPIYNSQEAVTFSMSTIFFKNITDNIKLNTTNNLKVSKDSYTNILRGDINWDGKSGSVFIIPILDYVIDYPYIYRHTESAYFKIEKSNFHIGLRHGTKLTINTVNETEAYFDIIYIDKDEAPLSISFGIYTTLIF